MNQNVYIPTVEEIKLGSRALASMPFSILEKKNPILDFENKQGEAQFSITGYFRALSKIIEYGYDNINTPYQSSLIMSSTGQEDQQKQNINDQKIAKQATYFALFALLEFIIQVPLTQNKSNESAYQVKLE